MQINPVWMQINPIWMKFCDHFLLFESYNKKKSLSVNVFSTKVLIGDTIFTSPTEYGTASYVVIRATRSSRRLQCKGGTFISHPRIEPAISRSAVKHSTDWANPAACVECIYCICASFLEDGRCVPKAFERVGKLNRLNLPATIFINVL